MTRSSTKLRFEKTNKARICQDPLEGSEKEEAIRERRIEENHKDDYEMEDIPLQEEVDLSTHSTSCHSPS